MKQTLEILAALWDSGILTALAYFGIKLLKSHTKNKNIAMFTGWAEQAVAYSEANFKTSKAKKDNAILFIRRRLKANKLLNNFSESQIEGAIESAVNALKEQKGK